MISLASFHDELEKIAEATGRIGKAKKWLEENPEKAKTLAAAVGLPLSLATGAFIYHTFVAPRT
jgi:hypothetical protein